MTLPRGRIPKPITINGVRELTREDLPRLAEPRRQPSIKKIRESHHIVARLLALGMAHAQVAQATGYSVTRVGILAASPAIADLVARYNADFHEKNAEVLDVYAENLFRSRNLAEGMLVDKLAEADESGELPPFMTLLRISRDAADRTGFGKHSTTDVNHDIGGRLERAIARSNKVIDVTSSATARPSGAALPLPTSVPPADARGRVAPIAQPESPAPTHAYANMARRV